mmetsp:Transcript_31531/g.102743  ORF Transcript_31531/g.102743 Transcript_31531/m.102743 type:complete len:275 (+) Transcript_31531:871-1695(+)
MLYWLAWRFWRSLQCRTVAFDGRIIERHIRMTRQFGMIIRLFRRLVANEDAAFELLRTRPLGRHPGRPRRSIQNVTEEVTKESGDLRLPLLVTMVLKGDNDWVRARRERRVADRLHTISKRNRTCQRPTMRHNRSFTCVSLVVTVELDDTAALTQCTRNALRFAIARELVPAQVGVVRRVDEVRTQRLRHVEMARLGIETRVSFRTNQRCQSILQSHGGQVCNRILLVCKELLELCCCQLSRLRESILFENSFRKWVWLLDTGCAATLSHYFKL